MFVDGEENVEGIWMRSVPRIRHTRNQRWSSWSLDLRAEAQRSPS